MHQILGLAITLFTILAIPSPALSEGPDRKNNALAIKFRNHLERAKWGNSKSQYFVGHMLYTGTGVVRNFARATYWYQRSAKKGRYWACFDLAEMNLIGTGVPRDIAKAVGWYRKSATQGRERRFQAQLKLGQMRAKGFGMSQDLIEAHMWFNLAARNIKTAIAARGQLGQNMTAGQLAKAQAMAAAWIKNHPGQ